MGIKFCCPNGHKLHVKSFLAGKRGFCPHCGVKIKIPVDKESEAVSTGGSSVAVSGERSSAVLFGGVAPSAPSEGGKNRAVPAQPAVLQSASSPQVAPQANPISHPLPDPIAEAPEAVWYVRPPSGGQYGPAPGEILRQWIGEGRVSADSLVWRDGWPDWRTAGALFPELSPGSAAPVPAITAPAAPSVVFPAAEPATPGSYAAAYRTRRRRNQGMVIAGVAMLSLISIGLLIMLIYVARL